MAFWPRDQRIKKSKSTSIKRKAVAQEHSRSYPNVEHGLLGAATLFEDDNNHLNWIFVSKTSNIVDDSTQRRLKLGKQIQVFPPTRLPPPESPKTNIKQRAEQGANFLRTYLPDIEIPEELIRDQLIEDTIRSRELRNFDPYLGDIIDIFTLQKNKNTVYATFPTGETNRDLSYATIAYSDPSQILFKPSGTHLHRFPTPIQQIVSSKHESATSEEANIAIRTYTSTKLFNIQWNSRLSKPVLREDTTLTLKDVNNEPIVDMKYLFTGDKFLAVGDEGSVFMYNIFNGELPMLLYNQRENSPSDKDHFWRLATGIGSSDYFLMASKKLLYLDTRADSAANFLSFPVGSHVLTSIENCHANNVLSLCSTNEIIWMDIRFPRNPLLAYAHGRQHDRYLSSRILNSLPDNLITILTSRNNSLITAYDVSSPSNKPITLNTLPYCLPSDYSMYQTQVGQQVVEFDKCTALLRVSESEGVVYNELLFSESELEISYAFERTHDMNKLVEKFANLEEDTGPFGRQEYSLVDLQAAYEAMFCEHFQGTQEFEEQTTEAVNQMLDYFPSYLMNKEFPTEYMLTTYDIAFRAGDDGNRTTKASYLTESLVQSKRGYNALKQGDLSSRLIRAPLHLSLFPTLQKFDKSLSADSNEMADYLQKFRPSDDVEHVSQILEHEDASRQLILDLALSFDVFSETPVSKYGEADQTLENMTEALSLGDEPPPIEFGYLKPLEKKKKDIYAKDEEESTSSGLDIPMGVRLLLQGWDTSDPESYEYQDPYKVVGEASTQFKKSYSQSQSQVPVIQSQRPPQVLASNVIGLSQPDPFRRTAPKVQSSQTPTLPALDPVPESLPVEGLHYSSSQSQEIMASTQILPGPHGGRPSGKKKPPKKRLGGF